MNQEGSSSSKDVPTEDSSLLANPKYATQEYGTVEPQQYQRSRAGFCKYIIIFLCLITSILLLFIVYWVPGIAEQSVDKGVRFQFQKAAMLDMDDNHITMHVSGQIALDSKLTDWTHTLYSLFGTIETRQTKLDVYMNETSKIGTINLPSMVLANANVTEFDFINTLDIQDKQALMDFCQSAVAEKVVYWNIKGPLAVSFGWWGAETKIDKSVELQGMDGLKKTDMKAMSFPGEHELGGIAIEATVGVFNPSSVLSLTLGDVNFGIYLIHSSGKEIQIAVVQAFDADLQGNQMNYFNVTGRSLPLDDKDPVTNQVMSHFLTRYIHGEEMMVTIRGSPFGPDDQPSKKHKSTTPAWLRKALEHTTLTLPFSGATETDLIRSLKLSDIIINFSDSGNALISGKAVSLLKKPKEMQFDMDVTDVDIHAYLYLDQNSTKPFALVDPKKSSPAKTYPGGQGGIENGMMRVDSELDQAPFQVLEDGQGDFDEFMKRVYYQKESVVYIGGKVDAKVVSAFGNLVIRDLDFKGEIVTKGMEGMKKPPPKVTSLTLTRGTKEYLEAQTDLVIYSPSDVYINLGELNMYLLFNGHVIGHSNVPELALYPSVENQLSVTAWLYGTNETKSHLVDFIGQYISSDFGRNAKNLTLTISGNHPNATKSKFLKSFVQNLSFDVKPPPFAMESMLADVQVNILSSTAVMSMRNPFDGIMMTIVRINATASHVVDEVGTMIADFEDMSQGWKDGPLELPPPICDPQCHGVVIASEKIPVVTKKLGMDIIKRALGGSLDVSVNSIVGVRIGGFVLDDLIYQQSNITAKVRKSF